MNHPVLPLTVSAFAALLAVAAPVQAQTTAFTEPVGYFSLAISPSSDNVLSLPMMRDAVFGGNIATGPGNVTASSFKAVVGSSSPGWAAGAWKYAAGTQPQTYYVEFTSGVLKGLFYKVADNTSDTLTLDTEGDSLLAHPMGALVAGDSFKIRPYWRIRDVFESNGTPVIVSRPNFDAARDDILLPNYTTIGQNKAANIIIYHLNSGTDGVGWRAVNAGNEDKGDTILRPNEAFVLRRRGTGPLTLTNLGGVQMIRSISFIAGGNGTTGNDTYISINRPAPVTLNLSGLRNSDQSISVIRDSVNPDNPGDRLLAFAPGEGYNRAPNKTYYYLKDAGWRLYPNMSTDVGGDLLQPGTAYIVRKAPNSPGKDWVNDPNY